MSTVLLRQVPVASPVHRLWAGTKMIGVFLISLVLMFLPSWPVLGVMTAFLVFVGVAARLPLGTLPRLPWWFWALFVVGGLITVPVGGAAVLRYAQIATFTLILIAASFLIAWTTPMGDIAPALAKLGAPLRRLRIPVDEWAVVVALTLRGLPLLMEEIRVLPPTTRSSTSSPRPWRCPPAVPVNWVRRSPRAAAPGSSPPTPALPACATRWRSR
jgi:energy-coupling factor transport system permease protein